MYCVVRQRSHCVLHSCTIAQYLLLHSLYIPPEKFVCPTPLILRYLLQVRIWKEFWLLNCLRKEEKREAGKSFCGNFFVEIAREILPGVHRACSHASEKNIKRRFRLLPFFKKVNASIGEISVKFKPDKTLSHPSQLACKL